MKCFVPSLLFATTSLPLSLILLLFSSISAVHGQVESGDEDEQRKAVERWLLILDDPRSSLAQLTAAEAMLIERGPPALPYLRDSRHAAGQQRILRVRRRLEQQWETETLTARTFEFRYQGNVQEGFRQLASASGNRIEIESDSEIRMEVAEAQAEFWPLFDRLLDEYDLELLLPSKQGEAWFLEPRRDSNISPLRRTDYAGVFRVETLSTTQLRHFRKPQLNTLRVEIEIAWEPRLVPLQLQIPTNSLRRHIRDEATDSRTETDPVLMDRKSVTAYLSQQSTHCRLNPSAHLIRVRGRTIL